MKWYTRLSAVLMLAGLALPASAQMQSRKFGQLLRRVPEQANAMVLVDVDALFDSPLGKREQWRDRAANRPTGALGVSADASKLVVAAGVDLSTGEERWKVGMLLTHAIPPALTTLAAREGGYVEQLETQNVAWTPRNFYLLSFPERIVGLAMPSDRQLLSGWLKNTFAKPRTFPPSWADRAIIRADAGSPIILAVNLEKAVAPKSAEAWLRDFQSETVKRNKINFDILSRQLADVRSAHLQVDVKESIQGSIRIDFESSIELLRPIAKELVLAALADYGANVDDLKRWTFEAKGTTITMSGPLTEAAVRRFLSFVSAPRLSPTDDKYLNPPPDAVEPANSAQPPQPANGPTPDVVLKATQQHYRSVVEIAHTVRSQKPDSQRGMKLWYDRSARQIEELPLLYVDTEVLDWSSTMARSLREMAFGINYAAKDTNHRIAGTANGYYGPYGYGGSRAVSAEVIKKQTGAALDVSLNGRWQDMETSIADMRRKLVAKYKVEF